MGALIYWWKDRSMDDGWMEGLVDYRWTVRWMEGRMDGWREGRREGGIN